jgi:hypothetical protein
MGNIKKCIFQFIDPAVRDMVYVFALKFGEVILK